MTYNFKPTPEALWAIGTAVVIVVLQAVVDQPTPPTDMKAWLIALGGGCLRAAIGAAIALYTKNVVTKKGKKNG